MVRTRRRSTAALLVALVGWFTALGVVLAVPAQATDYEQLNGDGSTWSQLMLTQWGGDVQSFGIQIVYTGSGSSAGRKNFSLDQDDFAISEIPFQGKDPVSQQPDSSSRPYAYLPIVAGGTSLSYHITVGGKLLTGIRLSGQTIAKIFTRKITNWNDPAVVADNNGRSLPNLEIHPVARSDGSGTTAQFTKYLVAQYPDIWQAGTGLSTFTSNYPSISGMTYASGSDQVMNTIAADSGNGTIGYVEYQYANNANFPVVKLLNAAGYYVEPTQYNVAVALTKAQINDDKTSQDYLTQILTGVYTNADPRAYPMSSYSYMIIPTSATDLRMNTSKRQTLVDFLSYALCKGQSEAGTYGYSPMPLNLVQAAFTQVAKLHDADPNVSLSNTDVTKCGNPTFSGTDLSVNKLAQIAPQPPACDKQGAGPCTDSTTGSGGSGTSSTTQSSGSTSGTGTSKSATTSASATGSTTGTGTGTGTSADGSGAAVDPDTGQVVAADVTTTGATGATATEVSQRPAVGGPLFGGLAAAELAGLVIAPGVVLARRRRPGGGR